MANAYRVLGQAALAANTDTNLYTVPSATETIVSTLVMANRGTASTTYRIAIRPNGTAIADLHYLAFDVALSGNDSTTLTLGLTLDASDVLTVRTAGSSVTASLYGLEVS
jgi:hypothetical protein